MPVTPLILGSDLLDRADSLAQLAGNPDASQWSPEADVLRAAWTFTAAAIDTYFHERVRGALLAKPLSSSAQKFSLPLHAVEDLVEGFLADRIRVRPRVRLKTALHDALLLQTFQGVRNIEGAFALIGIKGYWATISTGMQMPTGDIKNRLNRQYDRRNKISHQGDYSRQERRQRLLYDRLDRGEVDSEIVWTRQFLQSADLA